MLTADLVRATVHRGRVRPCFVDPRDEEMLALAERLIATFEGGAGRPRYEIQGELDDLAGTETDFLLQRGLAKLLFDRSEFATEAVRDPEELRREVFSAAARLHRDRPAGNGIAPGLIDTVAREVGLPSDEIATSLFADLREEQIMRSTRAPSPAALLEAYNTALAQAVLLRATRLDIEIGPQTPARYRELFRSLKFHRLLHQVSGSAEEGYRIHL
ncbi:MAG TPA: DUF790 family protein, partial [Planctomycetota bacterium]|nr:DUF790 family protein [Planctomycetota bacterium]